MTSLFRLFLILSIDNNLVFYIIFLYKYLTMNKPHIEIVGNGTPLVLLHGWGWHSGIWHPLLHHLEKKYQIFLVDLPGFGKSPLFSEDYTLQNIVPLILENVPDQAAWLGWSMGGLFAYWAAIHFPQHVTHLITVASSPRPVCDQNWPGVDTQTLEKFSRLLNSDYQKTLLDFLTLQLRGSPKRMELFSVLKEKFFVSDQNQNSFRALFFGLKLLQETDLRSSLSNINCPSLHIMGQLDTIFPARLADLLPEHLPNGQYKVIKHTGHLPFLTHQEEFLLLLMDFL